MPRSSRAAQRFVRALLTVGSAEPGPTGFLEVAGDPPRSLPLAEVLKLVSAGVLHGDGRGCRAGPGAAMWLRRQLLDADAFAAQHRLSGHAADGIERNLAESPLIRLATARPGAPPFLAPHHVEAGERVRKFAERAQLRPRMTVDYAADRVAGGRGATAADIGDLAVESRRALDDIARLLPRDCAGVVFDVCGLLKGLQTVERERGWPRRSAKLVLRIGLEQLAQHYGLSGVAVGPDSRRPHAWLGPGARPRQFG